MKKQSLAILSFFFGFVLVLHARFYIGMEGGGSVEVPYETNLRPHNFTFASPGSKKITHTSDIENQGFSAALVLGSETFSNPFLGQEQDLAWGMLKFPFSL